MDAQLNLTKSIWIRERQLGTIRVLRHRGRKIKYRLPEQVENSISLRFKGHGKTRDGQTGDLILVVRVDRGHDRTGELWISETEARKGCAKRVGCQNGLWRKLRDIEISVPALSSDGSVLRERGRGEKSKFCRGMPFFNRPRGDLTLKLRVFPDTINPNYRHVDELSTEHLALEGWVYRKRDDILGALGPNFFPRSALTPSFIADTFNLGGWRPVAEALIGHLRVENLPITFEAVENLPHPGEYYKMVQSNSSGLRWVAGHVVKIRSEFTNDPFAVTAILAHEICHVLEDQSVARRGHVFMRETGKARVEMERTVDLLVFLCQLGEFQLRVARQHRQTFGYFDQEVFERMYVILQLNKKRK